MSQGQKRWGDVQSRELPVQADKVPFAEFLMQGVVWEKEGTSRGVRPLKKVGKRFLTLTQSPGLLEFWGDYQPTHKERHGDLLLIMNV